MKSDSGKKQNKGFSVTQIGCTILIVLANVAVFFYLKSSEGAASLVPGLILSPNNIFVKGRVATILTSGFLHGNGAHLFFNCLGIFIFGSIVERKFGAVKTLFIYLGALVLSMSFSLIIYTFFLHKNVAIIGASGALMGLISCAMLADPFAVTYEVLLPIPVMIKGWMFFYADIRGFLGGESDGVSHLAHMLGFLSVGVIIYFMRGEDRRTLLKGLAINIISFGIFLAAYHKLATP